MTVLPLVYCPDPRLQICSAEVVEVNDEIRTLMDDMLDTMYENNGIGLAAVQVGVHKRVLVIDLSHEEDKQEPIFVINPEIIAQSEEENIYEEGCLSFPGQVAKVMRPKEVTVKFLDRDGNKQTLKCEDLLATCIQHEIDHLNGISFVDHLSKMRRDMIVRKIKKSRKSLYEE